MKVRVKGRSINLGKNDFVAKGGEGSVYVKGSHAYKIYEDPKKMISTDKMAELGAITRANVIKPEQAVQDSHGAAIGYTMSYVDNTHPLCQVFTQAFRNRHSIDDQAILDLVQVMRDTVQHIHDARILVVDLNELNFLVGEGFDDVFFIDVDSYQTPHFPATALMASVKDPQTPIGKFTPESDWFSWACVTFQMLIGMHPYKGKHKTVKGMEKRMEAGVSVFNPEVRVPKMCAAFDVIPTALRDWYRAVLEDGKRVCPPTDIGSAGVVALRSIPIVSTRLAIKIFLTANGKIRSVSAHEDRMVVRTAAQLAYYIDGTRLLKQHRINSKGEVAVCWHDSGPYAFNVRGGKCKVLQLASGDVSELVPRVDQIMEHDGRVYLKSGDKILQVQVAGKRIGTTVVANVVPKASRLYPGCCVQSMLGSVFVNVFTRANSSNQIRIAALDGVKIVDAKFDGRTLIVVGAQDGYKRFVFELDDRCNVESTTVADVGNHGINFVSLGTGINVCLDENEDLEMWGGGKVAKIHDEALSSEMQLFRKPGKVMFFRGNEIYSMAMS